VLRVLDLFSGIGGFSLGLERTGGFETVAFCEIEEYPRRVLAKHWPDVPCYTDVRELTHERLEADGLGGIDIIVGGYPCQPFSQAGQRRGQEDDRHLWPEVKRLMATVRPTWGVFENVAGHISLGLDQVLSDLEDEGYTAWPLVIPACAVDAPHRRDRVWIISNQQGDGWQQGQQDARRGSAGDVSREEQGLGDGGGSVADARHSGVHERRQSANAGKECQQSRRTRRDGVSRKQETKEQVLAHAANSGCEEQRERVRSPQNRTEWRGRWEPEPPVGRVAHGVPSRVDRLKALGNSVVPQIPEMIGRAILEADR